MPNLNDRGLKGSVAYADGQFDDARYNVTLVQTFTAAGGNALNYARSQIFCVMRMGGFQALELRTSKAGLRSQSTQRPSLTPRGSSRTPYANSRILHYASAYGRAKVHTSCCHSLLSQPKTHYSYRKPKMGVLCLPSLGSAGSWLEPQTKRFLREQNWLYPRKT